MTADTFGAEIDAAIAARATLPARTIGELAEVLAAAGVLWGANPVLRAGLVAATGLSAPMIAAVLPRIAAALDRDAMTALAERELDGIGNARPALVTHVVASNVPGLAVPAIALAVLAGVTIVIRSGRNDPLSAPAFHAALAAIDPDLAATIVTAPWPIGDHAAFDRATRVLASGSDDTMASLTALVGDRLVAYGSRTSVVVIARGATANADALARDITAYDQRGCLSPRIVYVEGKPEPFATHLARALGALANTLPVGRLDIADHAALRATKDEAEWSRTVRLHTRPSALVLVDDVPGFAPPAAPRTVRVYGVSSLDLVPDLLPAGAVECVGYAGDVRPLHESLRARGVARLCPIGRMQDPPLSWPRGQRSPIRSLLGIAAEPRCEVET